MAPRKIPEDEAQAIGRRLRAWRDVRGLTQRDVARLVGMAGDGISDLERGNTGGSLRPLRDVCLALGLTYDQLLGVPGSTADATPSDDFEAGYRAGVAESLTVVRELLVRADPQLESELESSAPAGQPWRAPAGRGLRAGGAGSATPGEQINE